MMNGRNRWFLVGLFLTTVASLLLEVLATRLLSAMTWYHLSFFAVSVAMFGMGLFLAGGWTLLSWLLPLAPGVANSPWTIEVAQQLQMVRNLCDSEESCCESPQPEWELTAVRCAACRTTLLNLARPDLGRPRSDGKIKGLLRIWISDGGPMMAGEEE